MEVESLGSLPVSSLWWRLGDKPWSLSVLCKGTMDLTPGELRLAARQDPVVTLDRFAKGDHAASLYAPSDLPPRRPLVDVAVVGFAYAPDSEPVDSITARLQVGSLDKSVTIHAEGRAAASGPQPFAKAPLLYELAAGGPGTSNPVGVPPKSDHAPPRLVLASSSGATGGGDMPPAGLGPIAAHWPGRQRLLKTKTTPAQPGSGGELSLPASFDLRYYNAAPSDQQLKELEPGADIVLENLHPAHAVLRTRLPKMSPQVFVLTTTGERLEQAATADALWIDTDRLVATVNWRAQLEVGDRASLRKVWVVITEAGKRMSWEKLAKLVDTLGAPLDKQPRRMSQRPPKPPKHRAKRSERPPGPAPWPVASREPAAAREESRTTPRSDGPEGTADRAGNPGADEMNEQGEGEKDSLEETQAIVRVNAPQKARRKRSPFAEDTQTEITASVILEMPRDGAPSWLASGMAAAGAGPASENATPSAASGGAPTPPGPTAAPASTSNTQTGPIPAPAPASMPSPPEPAKVAAPPTRSQAGHTVVGPLPDGRGLQGASPTATPFEANAAQNNGTASRPSTPPPAPSSTAGMPPPVRPPTPTWMSGNDGGPRNKTMEDTSSLPRVVSEIREGTRGEHRTPRREVVELLWFDEETTPRVRRQWKELTDKLEFAPIDVRHDLPTTDPKDARDRHTNFGVLTEAGMTEASQLSETLRRAISEDGRFTPPLIVIGGSLHFPFDELEILRATAASLAPLAGDDKKLKEALANVNELLDTPLLQHSNELVDNFTKHLRKVYGQSKRALTRDYLDATVERMLLEQRRYQKRTIFDGDWIRALLHPPSGGEAIPTYLPESLAKTLPMMVSFNARMIVEANVRQDQYEPHGHALRVAALGRVLPIDRNL